VVAFFRTGVVKGVKETLEYPVMELAPYSPCQKGKVKDAYALQTCKQGDHLSIKIHNNIDILIARYS